MSLTEVFPVEPVIPITLRPARAASARARSWSAASGSSRRAPSPSNSWAPRSRIRTISRAHCGPVRTPQAPASSARSANSPPSTLRRRSARRTGRRARPRGSRSRALGRPVRAAGEHLGAGPLARRASAAGQLMSTAPAARRRSSSRATSRSSNGIFRPSSNSWPCSWPLPAMTTVSPSGRWPSASAIAARPVDLDDHVRAVLDARRGSPR